MSVPCGGYIPQSSDASLPGTGAAMDAMPPPAPVPSAEIAARVERLQHELTTLGLDGALIMQQMDLYYFTGTAQNAVLIVPASGSARLLVRRSLERARAESPLAEIEPLSSWRELPAACQAAGLGNGAAIGLELDVLPAAQYLRFQQQLQPGRLADISPAIRAMRSRKSAWELEQLRLTVPLAQAMYETARDTIRPGMTELELSGAVEAEARRRGHMGLIQTRGFNQRLYWGCALAGPNAVAPSYFDGVAGGRGLGAASPQGGSFHRIAAGEPVLVDLCALANGYVIDHTRVFSIGPLPPDLARAQAVAEDIYHMVVDALRPGVTGEELYNIAVDAAERAGLGDYFMGYGPDQVRFIGHGVGLELDELPVLARGFRDPLLPGTVVAIEPKFALPGRGVVGLENTVAITANGAEVLGYEPSGLTVL